jgi:hypothetical protein
MPLTAAQASAVIQHVYDALQTAGPAAGFQAIQADLAAFDAERLRKWEAARPMRERAEAIKRRADLARARQFGSRPGQRSPVVASGWAQEPARSVIW